ncbi:peptidase U32 family protein [Heyndrickxia acidiproducens]|uniref:peptidase U32 family protein n=1 Tax=Heyndrickxia acidiproducens TaxID=1121084 RepID=UPI000478267A|nr:peptidase U32 family protein [Heyndrickxia acidiproducens]
MNMIATAESAAQAKALLEAGIDTLYIGDNRFGLRMPRSISKKEMEEIAGLAHAEHKKVTVAVNGLMHNEHIAQLPDYLTYLQKIGIDAVTVGDPGVIMTLKELELKLPYIYDAQTLVTSASQIRFWLKRGAAGAVAARECTFTELKDMQSKLPKPVEVQVYGPTCIHHSKRKLLTNYYQFAHINEGVGKENGLNIRETKDEGHPYPIYQDENGTHIFSSEDIALISYLPVLLEAGLDTWKLDGVLMKGQDFVNIARLYVEAKQALLAGNFEAQTFADALRKLQPQSRRLGTGFFLKRPDAVQ